MPLPLIFAAETVLGLLRGPLAKILDAYVSDLELKRKLQAEIESQVVGVLGRGQELGAGIVSEEIRSEHWLTRSWRPLLMLMLMGFLVLTGLILPIADMIAGHAIHYRPRWSALPPEFWNFLMVGMGGYIGGRSVEKAVNAAFSAPATHRSGKSPALYIKRTKL